LDRLDEQEPNKMKRVAQLSFLFHFAHQSRFRVREKELGGSKVVSFVVLVKEEEEMLGTASLAGRPPFLAGLTSDNVCHHQ
jgi:hypothetical protein